MNGNLLNQVIEALEIACDHIDLSALATSHANDLAKIRAALAAIRQRGSAD